MINWHLKFFSPAIRGLGICLAVSLLLAPPLFGFAADTPVTPGASPEACSLLAFFGDTYGKKIISGQQDGWQRTNGLSLELNYITNVTGKLPALLAMDLSGYTGGSPRGNAEHLLARRAADWFSRRNGIVEFCCHWRAPMDEPAFYTKDTRFDIARAVTEGTPEYVAAERDLDLMAAELEVLRDAHVPVLWRPLHEANGRWFWWGAGGPAPFKKLWHLEFENFTQKHHLNNLIWVFSPGAETDLADWYPGDAFVDIVGQDHYPMDGNHGSAKDVFDELTKLTRGAKLIALGENGPVPDPELIVQDQAGWLFFTTWSGGILFEKTTAEQLRSYYRHPYVLNLGDLPDLKNYPFQPAGRAGRLGFSAPPGDVAIGGTRRSPVTVAVLDAAGKTVRSGNYVVRLALKKTGAAKLSGTLSATTVNGIATFPDVKINDAAGEFKFLATAEDLRGAASPAFHVGPGNGLLRQWWTGKADFTAQADESEILGRDLETPVALATNFSARITGRLLPPQSGQYKFWVAGGGAVELWLSPDSDPAHGTNICNLSGSTPYHKWPHASEAESQTVTLTAGKQYYFEIRQRQANGSTQLHVRWQLPDGTEERPVPAIRFALPGR
jgi:mannan endo-1,4-beta-mannosidase